MQYFLLNKNKEVGTLKNNETQAPICMAPIFDLNMALLPYIEREDWTHIGTKMLDYGPRIGEDFTRIGQQTIIDAAVKPSALAVGI